MSASRTAGNCISTNPKFNIFSFISGGGRAPGLSVKVARTALVKFRFSCTASVGMAGGMGAQSSQFMSTDAHF